MNNAGQILWLLVCTAETATWCRVGRGQLAGRVPPCRPARAAELAPGQPRPPSPRGYVREPAVAGRPGAAAGEAALGAGERCPRPPASRPALHTAFPPPAVAVETGGCCRGGCGGWQAPGPWGDEPGYGGSALGQGRWDQGPSTARGLVLRSCPWGWGSVLCAGTFAPWRAPGTAERPAGLRAAGGPGQSRSSCAGRAGEGRQVCRGVCRPVWGKNRCFWAGGRAEVLALTVTPSNLQAWAAVSGELLGERGPPRGRKCCCF